MKNLSLFSAFILVTFVGQVAFAQEIDDMYFNSGDRAKINERKISADLVIAKGNTKSEVSTPINPTDSYSARNVNPEYAAQINSGSAGAVENDYFPSDYQPKGINQNLSNCNCGGGSFYNPYYGNNAFSNPYHGYGGGFGSPYSSFYPSSWGYPYGGFQPGLSLSMGYGWGGFSPAFYTGIGYGYSSFWNSYYSPWGYNGWGSNYWNPYYPGTVVVHGGDVAGNRVSYSKRASRSSNVNNNYDYSRPANSAVSSTSRSSISSGRTRTSPEYYDRGWKRNQESGTTRGYWNNSNANTNSNSRSDFNWGNSSSGGRQNSGFSTPSRGSFNSGGTNSSGSRSGSSGSSSGSRSRGRGN